MVEDGSKVAIDWVTHSQAYVRAAHAVERKRDQFQRSRPWSGVLKLVLREADGPSLDASLGEYPDGVQRWSALGALE